MSHRFLAPCGLAVLTAAVMLQTAHVAGQASPAGAKPATAKPATAKPTAAGAPTKVFRTPWGEPDLQGTFSSDDANSIPMDRPKQFGDRLWLTDEEFAERSKRVADALQRNKNAVGAFRGEVAGKALKQTSRVIDPPDGQTPALTPEAQKRAAEARVIRARRPESILDRSLYDRCITRGVLGSIQPVIYGNGLRIVQSPGVVAITYEMVHDTRVIRITKDAPSSVRTYLGAPRGHWEGDTLVVETTNFIDKTAGVGVNGGGPSTTESFRLVERFTRVAEDRIDFEARIDDPKTYTKPFTIGWALTTQPDYEVFVYECHEGNMGMANILSAARDEERKIADALAKGLPPPPLTQWLDGGAGDVYGAPGTQGRGRGGPGGGPGAPGGGPAGPGRENQPPQGGRQ